jgi:hypothetical protein
VPRDTKKLADWHRLTFINLPQMAGYIYITCSEETSVAVRAAIVPTRSSPIMSPFSPWFLFHRTLTLQKHRGVVTS